MNALSLYKLAKIVNGQLIHLAGDQLISSISTDTRTMQPRSLFIAIKGENHDGHQHLKAASENGAIAAIVSKIPPGTPGHLALIKVDDTRLAMGKIGNLVRKTLAGKVIAVAGSNGKTSTKYLIDSVLKTALRGTASPKSFNNDIGVPITIFSAESAHDYLVLEVGTNHHGEILNLTNIAQPDIAIITNCGAEHLEFLGDLAGVRKENAQIIAGLNSSGTLIVNGDDRDLLDAVSAFPGKRITFGFREGNDIFATDVRLSDSGVTFSLNGSRQRIFVPMLGKHTAANALAALAVGRAMGMTDAQIIDALGLATGPEWRLQLQRVNGVTILNDVYNANPNSMRAALETVRDLPTHGRRIAILGDMRELGETSEKYHTEIGTFAAGCELDALYCVGPCSALIAKAAEQNGMDKTQIVHFEDAQHCAAAVPASIKEGDLVLLKASRGLHLEGVVKLIGQSAQPLSC